MSEPRTDPPLTGSEAEVLLGFLEFHRETLRMKVAGLDDAQLRTPHPPSVITLAGMLSHLAFVEDHWSSHVLLGRDPVEPWLSADWDADPDHDWHLDLTGEQAAALLDEAVVRSREVVADLLASPTGLDTVALGGRERPSLRWVLVHLVEEYSRHNGHADLLREAIDGSVGE
jgi:uncharacterized damage-inducible protein DinB